MTKRSITISPKRKYVLGSLVVITYTALFHYVIKPNISFEWLTSLPQYIIVATVILGFIIMMAFSIYTDVYRPFVPGPATWQEPKFDGPLHVELSLKGFLKFILWLAKLAIFSTLLYVSFKLAILIAS